MCCTISLQLPSVKLTGSSFVTVCSQMVETQRCCWYLVAIILRERNADIQSSYDVITCTMAIGCDSH